MAASPTAAAVAHIFTKPYADSSEPFRVVNQIDDMSVLDGTGKHNKSTGMPRRVNLAGEAVLATLKVNLLNNSCTRVADHMIVVGKVMHVLHRKEESRETAHALAYAMQGYRGLGEQIQPAELQKSSKEADLAATHISRSGTAASAAVSEGAIGEIPYPDLGVDKQGDKSTPAHLRQAERHPLEDEELSR